MRRIVGVVAFVLLSAGCATAGSVKSQIDPLSDRIAALEKQEAALAAKQTAMDAKLDAVNQKADSQTAELKGLRDEVAASTAASNDVKAALAEARASADRAELAAKKSTKAFELKQVKGK